MIENELRTALQQETLGVPVSPDALDALPRRLATRRRRRRTGQAGGVGVIVIALVATGIGISDGGHRATPATRPEIVPTTAPLPQPSALAVLRSDGIHVGDKVLQASKGATSLGASVDSRFISWIRDGYGEVYDTTSDETSEYGRTTALAWSPQADLLAQGSRDGNGTTGLLIRNAVTQGEHHTDGLSVSALVWTPDGRRLAVGTAGAIHIEKLSDPHSTNTILDSTVAPDLPGAIPGAFSTDGTTLYLWKSLNSASLAADGLDLMPLDLLSQSKEHDVGTTLVRPDWMVPTTEGLYLILGGGREATDPKLVSGPHGPYENAGGNPISIAVDAEDGLLAQVDTTGRESSHLIITSTGIGRAPIRSQGIEAPLAVMSAPGGFLVLTTTELWSVSAQGDVTDLGSIDTTGATDHGIVRASDVVVPRPARSEPPPTTVPSPSPAAVTSPPSTDGDTVLAAVLRTDGLHVLSRGTLAPIPGTKGARRLGESVSGRYLSWLHPGSDGYDHAWVRDGHTGRVTDLGTAEAAAWDPGLDSLAVASERGLDLLAPVKGTDGSMSFPAHRIMSDSVPDIVWDPKGGRLAAESVPLGQPKVGGLLIVTLTPGDPTRASSVPLAGVPRCAVPAAWRELPQPALLVRPDPECSGSIAADGLPLDSYPLAGGAPTRILDFQLPYDDWIQVRDEGLLLISGGDREVADGKQLQRMGVAGPLTDAIGDSVPISLAISGDGQTLARVQAPRQSSSSYALPKSGQVYLSDLDGTHLRMVPGIDDARAVERAPGGFLIIGISELHEVYDDGTVKDLGPVDGVSNDYYGHVDPTDVVLPTLD